MAERQEKENGIMHRATSLQMSLDYHIQMRVADSSTGTTKGFDHAKSVIDMAKEFCAYMEGQTTEKP